MSDELDEALALVAPKIPQPELRELGPNERIVRTAGLRFIVPTQFKAGDVLTEQTATMLNVAYGTLVINRFATTRQELLSREDVDYEMIDAALQDHFENFKYNPRPLDSAKPSDGRTEEERELEAFARPHFQKAFGGKGIERKKYEELLREYVKDNKPALEKLKAASDARSTELLEEFETLFAAD